MVAVVILWNLVWFVHVTVNLRCFLLFNLRLSGSSNPTAKQ